MSNFDSESEWTGSMDENTGSDAESGIGSGSGSGSGANDGADADPELIMSLQDSALAMNEMYRSYREAHFTRFEALWLTGAMAKGVPMPEWLVDRLRDED